MNLILRRKEFISDGIFSELQDERGSFICVALEHAYQSEQSPRVFFPKIPPGIYKCERGMHQLEKHPEPFETFEITGITGHSNILFHVGNYNEDSEGCVLLGTAIGNKSDGGKMIVNSRIEFQKFMDMQKYQDTFDLKVVVP